MTGVAMVVFAASLALDPGYPLDLVPAAARTRASTAGLEPLAPRGEVGGDVTFHWRWTGGACRWRVTVLDADLQPLLRSEPVEGDRLVAPPELLPRLTGTAGHFWQVESSDARGQRTSPVWFRVLAGGGEAAVDGGPAPPR